MTKEDVLAGLRRQPVPFEAGGLRLLLKPWTAATRTEFAVWRAANPGPEGLMSKLFALSVCDEAGSLLFSGANPAELESLDGLTLELVGNRVVELNGLAQGPKD